MGLGFASRSIRVVRFVAPIFVVMLFALAIAWVSPAKPRQEAGQSVPPKNAEPGTPGGPTGFRRTPVYESVPPELPSNLNNMAVLIFSKTQAYRNDEAMQQANAALLQIAQQNGWTAFQTENGAVFNADMLKKFRVVVWNNTSGKPLTDEQQQAFQTWVENGGGWVGVHNSGGDTKYQWSWYPDTLIGAQFVGHMPVSWATIHVEDKNHPATRGLGDTWTRLDEWYSFAENPRAKGVHVLLTVDEKTYNPIPKVSMGADHPLAWWHCVGKGRAIYTALGHRGTSYLEPAFRQHLAGAISWAAGIEGDAPGCSEVPQPEPRPLR